MMKIALLVRPPYSKINWYVNFPDRTNLFHIRVKHAKQFGCCGNLADWNNLLCGIFIQQRMHVLLVQQNCVHQGSLVTFSYGGPLFCYSEGSTTAGEHDERCELVSSSTKQCMCCDDAWCIAGVVE
jgi:hypothetical protein